LPEKDIEKSWIEIIKIRIAVMIIFPTAIGDTPTWTVDWLSMVS